MADLRRLAAVYVAVDKSASAGFARCTASGCAALLADRLTIEETELLQSNQETL